MAEIDLQPCQWSAKAAKLGSAVVPSPSSASRYCNRPLQLSPYISAYYSGRETPCKNNIIGRAKGAMPSTASLLLPALGQMYRHALWLCVRAAQAPLLQGSYITCTRHQRSYWLPSTVHCAFPEVWAIASPAEVLALQRKSSLLKTCPLLPLQDRKRICSSHEGKHAPLRMLVIRCSIALRKLPQNRQVGRSSSRV